MQPLAPFTAIAQVYDAIMRDIEYDAWADFVLSYARDKGFEPSSALDLACGTGGLSEQLQLAGLEVTGADLSAEMLKRAAQRLKGVKLIQADVRELKLDQKFDLITCVFDSLNNLTADGELLMALKGMAEHLSAGGFVAFDVNTRLGVRELWEGDQIEGLEPLDDGTEVHYHWSHHYDAEQKLGVVQALCRVLNSDGSYEEFVELHNERGYDPADVEPLLREAGFGGWEIVEYPDYADPQADTPRIWVFAWLQGSPLMQKEAHA